MFLIADGLEPTLLQEGGFAFAALIFAAILLWVFRELRAERESQAAATERLMVQREQFIDRMLVRLEGTEQEHQSMIDLMQNSVEESRAEHKQLIEAMSSHTSMSRELVEVTQRLQISVAVLLDRKA